MSQDQATPSAHFPAGKLSPDNQPESGGPRDLDSATATRTEPAVRRTSQSTANRDVPDDNLVNATRVQIRNLVKEISDLAQSDCSPEEFYEGFLTRTTNALASVGSAIWLASDPGQPLKLQYHINLKQTGLPADEKAQQVHHRLLNRMIDRGEPALIGPDSASESEFASGNPTPLLLIMGPLKLDQQTVGLVEIFQRPGAGPTTQQGYLRFVSQMSEIASDYLRNHRLRSFSQQQRMWDQVEQFVRLVHQGLDLQQTAFTLANESRRLLECDRVSVALGVGRGCHVTAVSGLDTIERRADQVKRLSELARAVIRTGQPMLYNGDTTDLPPQLESKLEAYVDQSHSRMLAVIPLLESQPDAIDISHPTKHNSPDPIGALIVENLQDSRITSALRQRIQLVTDHGQTALTNVTEHRRIFLLPLWKRLGKLTSLLGPQHRIKTGSIAAMIAAMIAFLAWFPYSFGLAANGKLIPQTQFDVFAQSDGTMTAVHVGDTGDTLVTQGQLLGELKNSDIELAISDLQGKIANAKALKEAADQRLTEGGIDAKDKYEYKTQSIDQGNKIRSWTDELAIQQERRHALQVVSPAAGRVVTWNARQNLLSRPVEKGQKLMTIVPPDTVWQIELEMPERRLSHLFDAMAASDQPLTVTFGLVSHPGVEYQGKLLQVDSKLDVYSDEGNTALAWVAFENSDVPQELLRTETRVTAKVECGQRSIGYVMFHEVFETIESKLMFWF